MRELDEIEKRLAALEARSDRGRERGGMGLEDRIRRLEQQFARLDVPSLEEVGAAFGRAAERALARFRGEPSTPYKDQRKHDKDTIQRWADG